MHFSAKKRKYKKDPNYYQSKCVKKTIKAKREREVLVFNDVGTNFNKFY